MNVRFSRLPVIFLLCLAGLLPANTSAGAVVVVRNGRYHYRGGYYRYHHRYHYYNHRTWVVSGSGHGGYYRYW